MYELDHTTISGEIPLQMPDGDWADATLIVDNTGAIKITFVDGTLADAFTQLGINGHLKSLTLGYDLTVDNS